jgi:hypothetical protein
MSLWRYPDPLNSQRISYLTSTAARCDPAKEKGRGSARQKVKRRARAYLSSSTLKRGATRMNALRARRLTDFVGQHAEVAVT